MASGHAIPAFKKIGELLAGYLAGATGTEIVNYRISPWGPGGHSADICLDISRLREDTGYQPAYDTDRAVADYICGTRALPSAGDRVSRWAA